MGVVVRQKKKGRGQPWWVFISQNGKRTSRRVGDKPAAEAVASKIRAQLELGEFDLNSENSKAEPTFKEYADSWINLTVPATCKASTVEDYQDILRIHVMPVFADSRLMKITKGKVKNFLLGKVKKGYAASTVTHMKNVVSGVLNKACEDEVISANVACNLGKIFKAKKRNEDIDPLTGEELHHLLDTVKTHFPRHYPLFLLLARTGMRIGEALALKWGDIDWKGRFIKVQRNLTRGRIEEVPKGGRDRKVDMSKQLTATLWELKEERERSGVPRIVVPINEQEKESPKTKEFPEWLFINSIGGNVDVNNWRQRVFNKALAKAKSRKIRIHDLRHTYATLRIAKGDNVADVSNQLGHHSVKLTMDVYYHWMPGKKKEEVDALDDPFYLHPSAPYTHPSDLKIKKGLR